MKNLRKFLAALVLVCALSVSALAGHSHDPSMECPGPPSCTGSVETATIGEDTGDTLITTALAAINYILSALE